MGDFQAKYDGLIRRVQESKEAQLTQLTQLQRLYNDVMGQEDSSIVDRVHTLTSAYDSNISKLDNQRRKFDTLMSLTDAQLRIAHSNERINFDEDGVYVQLQDETQRARMRERTLTESEYWSTVFPSKETNPSINVAQLLPKLVKPKIVTIRDELSGQSTDSAFVERVNAAMAYVNSHVGTLYDLLALTKNELFGLENGLRQYVTADSSFRIEQMIDFVTPYRFSNEQWKRLTDSERETLTYTRKKDANSTTGDFSQMTKGREERLARIILKLYDRMVAGNSQFRTDDIPARSLLSGYLPDSMNASPVFYVEKFLADKVMARRDPMYAHAVSQNLTNVLQFHTQIRGILEPSEIASLDVDYQVQKMYNLKGWLKRRGSLTPKQRKFARDLMKQYVTRVQVSPVWTQEKVLCLTAAREPVLC